MPEFLGWQNGLGKTARRKFGEFVWDEDSLPGSNSRKVKQMTRIEGYWPDDESLITLADGDEPPRKFHFGGIVERISSDVRRVTVYID